MIRILLVDDHPTTRAGVHRLLSSQPDLEVVAEASTAEQAIDLATRLQPDVVVLDVDLPGGSGADVARALHSSQTRILAFSAHDGRGFVRALLDAGAAGYLTKDQPEAELLAAVRAVARGEGRWLVVPHDPEDFVGRLTPRERDVLALLTRGLSNTDIARTLFIAEGTVRNTLTSVYQKTNTENSRQAIAWAWKQGLGHGTGFQG